MKTKPTKDQDKLFKDTAKPDNSEFSSTALTLGSVKLVIKLSLVSFYHLYLLLTWVHLNVKAVS